MKTKQEQIDEMAVIGCVRNPQAHTAEECEKCDFKQGQCNAYRHAEALYSVVISREEYEMLANKYKNLEIKYSNLCDNYRLCKDANETLKQNVINAGHQKVDRLEKENERLKEVNRQLNADYNRSLERLKSDCRQIDELKAEVKELKAELNARLTCDFVKTAQKQAVQDFAEKAKAKSEMFLVAKGDGVYAEKPYVSVEQIDKLLEDMNDGND